jgi:preprotein translocase subunit SecE
MLARGGSPKERLRVMALEIYKRGQGKYTRLGTAFGVALIAAVGCYQLYKQLYAVEWDVSQNTIVWIATMVPAALFVIFAMLTYWLVNKPSIADFMIAAEGEMKKVSWSSRKEIAVSTLVVIVVVVAMSALLGVVDVVFQIFFGWILS